MGMSIGLIGVLIVIVFILWVCEDDDHWGDQ